MSLLLMIAVAAGPVWAQDAEPPAETAETTEGSDSTGTPSETAPAEGTPAPADSAESGWDSPAEAQAEPAPAPAPPAEVPLYKSYQDGFLDGQTAAAEVSGQYGLHGLMGLGAGCALGPCGCMVPAAEVLINPAVPNGVWRAQNSEYQQGYIEGYQRTIQRKRVIYSSVGVGVGTVVGVGAGLAFGAFAL